MHIVANRNIYTNIMSPRSRGCTHQTMMSTLWVAVKELELSFHSPENILYIHQYYVNLK